VLPVRFELREGVDGVGAVDQPPRGREGESAGGGRVRVRLRLQGGGGARAKPRGDGVHALDDNTPKLGRVCCSAGPREPSATVNREVVKRDVVEVAAAGDLVLVEPRSATGDGGVRGVIVTIASMTGGSMSR
jgi:hypothetical protein